MSNNDFLLKNGYFVGNLINFIDDNEYTELKTHLEEVYDLFSDKNTDSLKCRFQYNGPMDHVYPHDISPSQVIDRETMLSEKGYDTFQRWYYTGAHHHLNNFNRFFNSTAIKLTNSLYPNHEINIDRFSSNYTLFKNNDFISNHRDGEDENRLCVVLIYLNKTADYITDNGGQLVLVTKENNTITIPPIFGNFVILDFTKNNLEHSVTPIQNDFNRYAYNTFLYHTP